MSFDIIVGSSGRMSKELQLFYQQDSRPFKIYSPKAEASQKIADFRGARGIIDFSTPSTSESVLAKALEAKCPLVVGTTGWGSEEKRRSIYSAASKIIPVVLDSNFSVGIELLCQSLERLVNFSDSRIGILDIHHEHKKDSPSGTAIKIQSRLKSAKPHADIQIQNFRIGEVAGEHRVILSWGDEYMEFTHRAQSRKIFANGAMRALDWAVKQAPGLYSMEDILK
ncbi:MAG: 4-hydroxy-tetrahydrodipicolinate reductase [Deltaproteobacteria bacterium CG11_big_fil_rev_8_21_14_0_20_45_16]|nr:MAG: 4-hydroxy-tetrahydrodipicolinate reductase [Deltaproteobacteria bacterium CG11_big_fil_rev_8_21_14_0_20_45_16]